MKLNEIIDGDADTDLIRKEVKRRRGKNVKAITRRNNPVIDDTVSSSNLHTNEEPVK